MLIDTHTHLNFEAFEDDWREIADHSVKLGVKKMIVVGTDLQSSFKAVDMANSHKALYASVGIHPHHTRALREITNFKLQVSNIKKDLQNLLKRPRVVAVGEVGLDYHYYKNTKYQISNSKEELKQIKLLQKNLLEMQIELAKEFDKPLIVHSRETGEEVLELITDVSRTIGWQARGVFHCFEGSIKYASKILEKDFYISFTGNITYSVDRALVSQSVPLERLLLETDCPLLSPEPFRGKRNVPENAKIIAENHASLRSIQLSKVANITSANAQSLFDL